MRWNTILWLMLISVPALAQESYLHADFRREGERVSEACKTFSLTGIGGCAYTLFTDHPLHISAGSLPPQNGFALGPAFVTSRNTRNWRLSWNVDAVGATSGSWRAGGYMKLVHTPSQQIHVVVPVTQTAGESHPSRKRPTLTLHPYTVFNLYAQSISLNKLNFFGLGNDSSLAGASVFGMAQTIVGGGVIKPVYEWDAIRKLNLSLMGEVNGRWISIRGESGQSVPSIGTLYNNSTAPGLASQPGFAQFAQGLRIKPGLFGDHLQLNYMANLQEFVAVSDSRYSFSRWTVDFGHTIPLYSHTQSYGPRDTNGPDECGTTSSSSTCPPVAKSWNLNGSIDIRLLLSESMNSAAKVPFYFQPTLGGQDINSALTLGSYQDYRFRAPNVLLVQGGVEHSIWGPFGFKFMADGGRVAVNRSDIGFSHFRHSYAAGLTLRAGGFPMVSMMFAWGGAEGHHNIFNMNSALLGGSARPPLD